MIRFAAIVCAITAVIIWAIAFPLGYMMGQRQGWSDRFAAQAQVSLPSERPRTRISYISNTHAALQDYLHEHAANEPGGDCASIAFEPLLVHGRIVRVTCEIADFPH